MLLLATACSSQTANKDIWQNYHTSEDATDGYIDNDEYYVAPTGGYVNGATGGILDAD